ncbi:MAG: ABC transporter substrate-binding protein [Pseudomonadota bacterium]
MRPWHGIVLCLALLTGCGEVPQPPLRVGLNPWVGYDPLVLVRERGLLDADQVRVIELGSASEGLRAMRNGLLDAAALTLDETLRLANEGVALRIVAILDVSNGADAVLARPGIATPAQLRHRRIAVERTALGALMLDALLRAGGLDTGEVDVVHAEVSQMEQLIATGRVDAVVAFEPIKSRLVAQGYRSIFDSRGLPGAILDVLVVRAGVPEARVAALRDGWERGRYALLAAPQASAALLAPGVGLTPGQYLATLDGLDFMTQAESAHSLAGQPAPIEARAEPLVRTLLRLGLLGARPDWHALLGRGKHDRARP